MSPELIFDLSIPGRKAFDYPQNSFPDIEIDPALKRKEPVRWPEVSQLDLVRHYTRLSQMNISIDTAFYPLGSCTMKYNPKINEKIAALPGFSQIHPFQDASDMQGFLSVMFEFENYYQSIFGFDAVSLAPMAGSHGEFAGLMIIRKYFEKKGESHRKQILVPDSAHGTNPASAAQAGFSVISVKSNAAGGMDLEDLKLKINNQVAGLMLTNPNTLGLFDPGIVEIAELVHEAGALLYYDGANANALMGITRPGDLGFDIAHINTHKTFSTPHGGGGPGSGPIGVKAFLKEFLPAPQIVWDGIQFDLMVDSETWKLGSFWGNWGVLLRAWAYLSAYGTEGVREVSKMAVLNANYLKARLQDEYEIWNSGPCMHEFVISCRKFKKDYGVSALDIAKRLIDYGFHPPTMYFPLIVPECLMIEPTETESKETLDAFADAMLSIAREARENPELLKTAPHHSVVRRLDEATAARSPELCFRCG